MSGTISYKIGGKYDSKGEKDAIGGIGKITKAAKAFNAIAAGFIIGKVFEGINKVISGSTEAFTENKDAETKLFASINNNANLTAASFGTLKNKAEQLSSVSIFSGSQLTTQEAMLSNMKLNENQIDSTTKAAMDLASSGMMPLDQATKALGQTYSGNLGQLKKMCPELSNLTKEQLKNGEAVKIIAAQYKGMSEAIAGTFSGRDTQFKNVFGDLQSSVGAIGEGLKFVSEGKLMGPIKQLTDFINAHQKQLINFFLNLPEIAKISCLGIWEVIKRTFSGDNFLLLVQNIGNILLAYWKLLFQALIDVVSAIGETIWQPLKTGFINLGNTLRNAWADVVNFLGNKIADLINSITNNPIINSLIKALTGKEAGKFQFTEIQKVDNKTAIDTNAMAAAWGKVSTDFVNNCSNLSTTFTENQNEINSRYADIGKDTADQIGTVLNKDLPADLAKALKNGTTADNSNNSNPTTTTADNSTRDNLLGQLGQIGSVIKDLINGNPLGVLISAITSFISAISKIDSVNQVLNAFDTIFTTTAEILTSTLNAVFTPLVSILSQLGVIIGNLLNPILQILVPITNFAALLINELLPIFDPIIQIINCCSQILVPLLNDIISIVSPILIPIIKLLVEAVKMIADALQWIFNYIVKPILNFVIDCMTGFYNAIATVWNGIVDIFNSIQLPKGISVSWDNGISIDWVSLGDLIGMSKMGKANASDYKLSTIDGTAANSSGSTNSSSSTSSNSASYTAAKDVYVNIYYNNSFVNGDAREIAIQLKKEIQSAEKLGYA